MTDDNTMRRGLSAAAVLIFALACTDLTGCKTVQRYDDAPPISFDALSYPAKTQSVEIDGVSVAYVDEGPRDETALVLIHGLGENLGFWRHNLEELSRSRRVVALDLPGYGKSDKPEMRYTMAYYAGVVRALVERLELEQVVLVGHSMGGQVALTYALDYPGALDGLILAAPAGIETFDEGEERFLKESASTETYVHQTEDQIRSNFRNNLFYRWEPEYEAPVKERVQLGRSEEFRAYAWAVVQSIHAMLNEPVRERLIEIEAPTLVMFGRQDGLIPNPFLHGGESLEVGREAAAAASRPGWR